MAYPIPSPFAWDASFDVKNAKLNDQHKKLFTLINNLDQHRTSAAALKELLDLVVLHFKSEEELFHSKHYADEVGHKAIHDKFLQDAAGIKTVDDGVIQFIKNWLVNHIKGSDQKYAEALKD